MTERLMKIGEVIAAIRRSKVSIYKDIKKGTFPTPINLGPRSVAWRASDVERWLADRAVAGWTNCNTKCREVPQ